MIQADSVSQEEGAKKEPGGWGWLCRTGRGGSKRSGDIQGTEGFSRCGVIWREGSGKGESGRLQVVAERRQRGGRDQREAGRFFRCFGSEVGVVMVVPLARRASVVTTLSVAVPLVLPALPPSLVVVAAVAVGSPGWPREGGGDSRVAKGEKQGGHFVRKQVQAV